MLTHVESVPLRLCASIDRLDTDFPLSLPGRRGYGRLLGFRGQQSMGPCGMQAASMDLEGKCRPQASARTTLWRKSEAGARKIFGRGGRTYHAATRLVEELQVLHTRQPGPQLLSLTCPIQPTLDLAWLTGRLWAERMDMSVGDPSPNGAGLRDCAGGLLLPAVMAARA